ncbi:hypothetical protein [Parasitella parasitica]|uniref:RRM domain-containing protein n=1 Tax=Parasitella parasitica TaxID=35722 RepID=A0A0B7NHR3_9FUNG|nr:hypothetical protein [Parasitella parasitica]
MENQWTMSIPAEPTSRLVLVKNISLKTQEATIKDFFSFCGIITAFEMKKNVQDEQHQMALILFEKDAAAKTATLLSQAVVDDCPIEVEPYFKQVLVAENTTTPVATDSANAEQQQQQQQKQPQESKSASHVMAELLASGYVLTESVVKKGVEFDEKHGVSSRVNGYLTKMGAGLTQLNQRIYGASSEKSIAANTAATPGDTVDTTAAVSTTSLSSVPAPSRMQSLKNSRASLKVQGFASRIAGKVSSVHEEAKRIAAEKKNDASNITLVNDTAGHKPDQLEPQQK